MLVTLVALMLAAQEPSAPIDLLCHGGGAARHVENSNGYAMNSEGQSAWGTVQQHSSEAFQDQVDVHIAGDDSRIRLPRTMLPRIHGGDQGWFRLKNVAVGDQVITGSAPVNPLNSPKIYIDRRSGTISIDGKAGHYAGQCERADPANQSRRF